jgi:hypothetical protein
MPLPNISLITSSNFEGYDLKYDELNTRLNCVKKEFGLRRAVSTQSLTGETRTFAEILDLQVETIVLYYLEVQGILARQLRLLREYQVEALQTCTVNIGRIDEMCLKYRQIGIEVLELLRYLERNSFALNKILHRHDALFDQKMGSMYFDTRFNESQNKNNSQLRQLYHQEGVKALVASIRRGFEELYDAKKVFLLSQQEAQVVDGTDSPLLGRSFDGCLKDGNVLQNATDIKLVPKVSFRKRLSSFNNLQQLLFTEQLKESTAPSLAAVAAAPSAQPNAAFPPLDANAMKRPRSEAFLQHLNLDGANHCHSHGHHRPLSEAFVVETRPRSVSDVEPILHQITDVANKLLKTQNRTSQEFLSSFSALGLEFSMSAIKQAVQGEEGSEKVAKIQTDMTGLYINLFVTFVYSANQYVVAPTSAQYANRLGMSPSMSGMIIGLAPLAALLSSLVYSMWSNTSFKLPLLSSIFCGVLGNFFYASALQNESVMMLFVGRLISGFGSTRVISRRYIADHVSVADRLFASTQFVTAGALGLSFGPLIAAIVERMDIQFDILSWSGKTILFRYETVTAPGWIMMCMWIVCFWGVLLQFQEPAIVSSMLLLLFPFIFLSFRKRNQRLLRSLRNMVRFRLRVLSMWKLVVNSGRMKVEWR